MLDSYTTNKPLIIIEFIHPINSTKMASHLNKESSHLDRIPQQILLSRLTHLKTYYQMDLFTKFSEKYQHANRLCWHHMQDSNHGILNLFSLIIDE